MMMKIPNNDELKPDLCPQCMGIGTIGIYYQRLKRGSKTGELEWIQDRRVTCPNCNGKGRGGRRDYWNGEPTQRNPFWQDSGPSNGATAKSDESKAT